jgi:hypothetical protein
MKDKSLDEIRPVGKGVKAAARKVTAPQPTTRPQVIKNVQTSMEGLPPPSEEAARVVIESNRVKERLIEAIKSVNRLMNHRVLPENRSVRENDEERAVVTELVNSALAMETISPGEGLLGMVTLAVRQGLSLRDAGNRLAYELGQTRREVQALREQLVETEKKNG